MKQAKHIRNFTAGIALLLLTATLPSVGAQSADYLNMDQSLKLNEELFMYLDQFLTNLDDDSELKQRLIPEFKRAMLFDYYAQTWYLEGEFGKTRREVNDSRKILCDLYSAVLAEKLDRVYVLLEASAPMVAKTHDQDAKFMLTKGYSAYKKARFNLTEGQHHHILQYMDQINHYRTGLNMARIAGRYGVRALLETRIAREEKPQHMLVTLDEANGNGDIVKPKDREYIRGVAKKLIRRKQIEEKVTSSSLGKTVSFNLFDMIDDNYGYFVGSRTSIYLETLPTLSMEGRNAKDKQRQPGDP